MEGNEHTVWKLTVFDTATWERENIQKRILSFSMVNPGTNRRRGSLKSSSVAAPANFLSFCSSYGSNDQAAKI